MTKQKKKYKEPKNVYDLPTHLRGPSSNKWGGHRGSLLRGFKGSALGPANDGRIVENAERDAIVLELKKKGII